MLKPVANNTDKITVRMGLKLSQLVDLVRIAQFIVRVLRQDCSFNAGEKYQNLEQAVRNDDAFNPISYGPLKLVS